MTLAPIPHMKTALDLAPKSSHPTNKIAATLFNDKGKFITCHNHWPKEIAEKIGREVKIGNSSGTIHAETECILNADFATEGVSLCITDPFCPNCAKNIAEAGIKNIYIDKSGFDKDFFKRRGGHFDTMSMQICERAGINVFSIDMKSEEIKPILEIPKDYTPIEDSPIVINPIKNTDDKSFGKVIAEATDNNQRRKFCVAIAKDKDGKYFSFVSRAHAVIGYSMQKPEEALDLLTPIGKYSFIQEPVNRMMMALSRLGYTLCDDYLYCSQVPTSREQVNMAGAGIKRIAVGDLQKSRDRHGFDAMKQLSDAEIIDYS